MHLLVSLSNNTAISRLYIQVLLYPTEWSAVMLMISWTLNEQSDYECNLQEVLFTLFVHGGEILRSPIDVVY